MDVAVNTHGDQRMPVLYLDIGDVADVDVCDAHPRIPLDHNDIRQLGLDDV